MSTELDTRRAWAVLLVLSGAIFLEGIDVSMMGVALPSMREELDLSTSSLQWIVSAYVLGYGGVVLLGGRAADPLGRRPLFLRWLVGFFAVFGLRGSRRRRVLARHGDRRAAHRRALALGVLRARGGGGGDPRRGRRPDPA